MPATVPGYFNAAVPERTPTITQTVVTIAGYGNLTAIAPVVYGSTLLTRTLALSGAPTVGAALHLYKNGLKQVEGIDYTLSGSDVVFLEALTNGDVIHGDFF